MIRDDPESLGFSQRTTMKMPSEGKCKVKVCTLDIAPLRQTPPQKRSSMARVLKNHTVLPAHPHVHTQSE